MQVKIASINNRTRFLFKGSSAKFVDSAFLLVLVPVVCIRCMPWMRLQAMRYSFLISLNRWVKMNLSRRLNILDSPEWSDKWKRTVNIWVIYYNVYKWFSLEIHKEMRAISEFRPSASSAAVLRNKNKNRFYFHYFRSIKGETQRKNLIYFVTLKQTIKNKRYTYSPWQHSVITVTLTHTPEREREARAHVHTSPPTNCLLCLLQ